MERFAITTLWRIEIVAPALILAALLATAVLGLAWMGAAVGVDLAPMGIGTSPGWVGIGGSPA